MSKHAEYMRARRREARAKGLCVKCMIRPQSPECVTCTTCRGGAVVGPTTRCVICGFNRYPYLVTCGPCADTPAGRAKNGDDRMAAAERWQRRELARLERMGVS